MNDGIQPSPSRPARRMAGSLLPPIHSGNGCCTGRGSTLMRSSCQNSPANVTGSSAQQRRMMAIASSVRRPRSLKGTPAARHSPSCPTPKPTAGSMRPPEREPGVAIRVFARNGYYNSRVSDIAREAGIASGTIYLYFRTKDEILVTLFREKMAQWVALVRREIATERGAEAKIRKLVALHFAVLEGDPDLAEVVQVELRQGHKFFRGASAHEVSAYFDLIGSTLHEGMAAGQIRADLPVKIATKMLFGAMDQMATSWVLGKRGYHLTETAEAVASIFLRGVPAHGV